jgi:hypothetical protein
MSVLRTELPEPFLKLSLCSTITYQLSVTDTASTCSVLCVQMSSPSPVSFTFCFVPLRFIYITLVIRLTDFLVCLSLLIVYVDEVRLRL